MNMKKITLAAMLGAFAMPLFAQAPGGAAAPEKKADAPAMPAKKDDKKAEKKEEKKEKKAKKGKKAKKDEKKADEKAPAMPEKK